MRATAPCNVFGFSERDARLQIVGQRNDGKENQRENDQRSELHAQ
jgi:hypothetical protein